MSTVEDFKNAPVGATATHKATGDRAMKMDDGKQRWMLCGGSYLSNAGMVEQGFTLDRPVPATAREARDLAWELAHPVKPGQVIPKGTRYLEFQDSWLREDTAAIDFKISLDLAPLFRTLDPLPDPEPDWLDAPAVLATTHWAPELQEVWFPKTRGYWKCPCCGDERHWSDLRDVVPLYPLNEGTLNGTTAPDGYTHSNSMGLNNEEAGA